MEFGSVGIGVGLPGSGAVARGAEKWQSGRVEEWKSGRVEEWWSGGVVEWWSGGGGWGVWGGQPFAEAVCRRQRKPQVDALLKKDVLSGLSAPDRFPVLRTQVVPTCATRDHKLRGWGQTATSVADDRTGRDSQSAPSGTRENA